MENHMGWKLVKGVRKDVINLFKMFGNTNSVRYEDFCKVWKELNFSLIYSHRTAFIELLEFTEELFQIVKEHLLSVYEFHTRVAALYTLYGLYFKQPIKQGAKVRFTKLEWEEVQSLIAKCKSEKHYDVVFIHLKLYLSGAYNFVATIRPAGLEHGFKKYYEKRALYKLGDVELLYRPLLSQKLVNSLVQLETLYCKKKSELLGKRNIVFIDGKFATSLQEELKNYGSGSQKVVTSSETPSTNANESDSDDKDIGNIRAGIKTKSYQVTTAEESSTQKKKKNPEKRKETQLQLLAKEKAEYYIKKLKQEASREKESSSNLSLPTLNMDDT